MYELIEVHENVYYIKAPVNTGLFVDGNKAWLIDSGSGDDHAKKLLNHVNSLGLKVAGIVSTHSNADHIGGNSLIQARTGCRIFATLKESLLIEKPELVPSFLWGACPPAELKNRFLMAKPSKVTDILEPLPCAVSGTELEAVPLPGHFIDMAGIKAPGDVFFIADSVVSPEVLQKYHIGFLYDVGRQFETLNMLENTQAKFFIPAHAEPAEDISGIVQANRSKMEEICVKVIKLCSEPAGFETILFGLFSMYSLKMDFNQYVLVGATLKAYITYLKEKLLLEAVVTENSLLFKSV